MWWMRRLVTTHSVWFDSSQSNSANSSSMYFEGEQFVESLDGVSAPRAFFLFRQASQVHLARQFRTLVFKSRCSRTDTALGRLSPYPTSSSPSHTHPFPTACPKLIFKLIIKAAAWRWFHSEERGESWSNYSPFSRPSFALRAFRQQATTKLRLFICN